MEQSSLKLKNTVSKRNKNKRDFSELHHPLDYFISSNDMVVDAKNLMVH